MLLFASALFWILIIWGLYDTSIYVKEAAIWAAIWLVLLAGCLVFFSSFGIGFIAGMCLVDAILVIKFIGNPTVT